ncbi:hypothetical protein [Variovorax sp. PBL-E5]|uniref:hypothetical protein n=1 Tax=Variovorax sp. PBL-E5 TaxID=434014 RepID=UPI001317E54F|nr:hypothetical protein [Variovorax sp. PBL-E5]VTU36340.1 hypothetical protein E5CHR_04293 [Variovorax sp. PBL-E5]
MKGRVIAWVIFLAVLYGAYLGARSVTNPWAAPKTAVSSIGGDFKPCSEKCK